MLFRADDRLAMLRLSWWKDRPDDDVYFVSSAEPWRRAGCRHHVSRRNKAIFFVVWSTRCAVLQKPENSGLDKTCLLSWVSNRQCKNDLVAHMDSDDVIPSPTDYFPERLPFCPYFGTIPGNNQRIVLKENFLRADNHTINVVRRIVPERKTSCFAKRNPFNHRLNIVFTVKATLMRSCLLNIKAGTPVEDRPGISELSKHALNGQRLYRGHKMQFVNRFIVVYFLFWQIKTRTVTSGAVNSGSTLLGLVSIGAQSSILLHDII